MKLAVFSAKPYDRRYLKAAAPSWIEVTFHEVALNDETAALLRPGYADAVCAFVNDQLPAATLDVLHEAGVRALLLRCAGYNNVDLAHAETLGLFVANVPSYSPEAVAEFGVGLIQTLNRKTHRAHARVREGNFALDGLLGRTLHGKTVGLIGTGRIGIAFARIMSAGFGCNVIAHDPFPSPAFEQYGTYTTLDDLLPRCDIVSLHCPLTPDTRHIINARTLSLLKSGAMLLNTSRGGLVHTPSVIEALKTKRLAALALDVYEGEGNLFYNDHSGDIIQDDQFMRLMTFHNVLVCGHQAFFTEEALTEIAECTMRNLEDFDKGRHCKNALVNFKVKKDKGDGDEAVDENDDYEGSEPEIRPIARRDSLPVRTV